MCRMNTFGYADMRAFATAIQKRGVGALELNATGMKAAGAYVCRSLSYEGAEFKLDRIAIDKKATEVYDHSSEFVTLVLRVLEQADLVSMPARDEWADLVAMEKHQKTQIMSTQLWSGLLRFFKSMLMAAKVPKLAQWSLQAAQQGYQVVIGLQSTGLPGRLWLLTVDRHPRRQVQRARRPKVLRQPGEGRLNSDFQGPWPAWSRGSPGDGRK